VITGGAGADKIFGGLGSDTIYAADGERDVIDCGDGRDRAIVDSVDVVNKNCEVVQTVTSSPPSSGGGSNTNPIPTPSPTPPGGNDNGK
jgi:Ca2+-binding RTX toxin-like protein